MGSVNSVINAIGFNLNNTAANNVNSAVFNSDVESLDLQTLLHHSYQPSSNYFLRVKPHLSWSAFVDLLGSRAADWAACKACKRTWDVVSTLSDNMGQPVIFRDSLSSYPEFASAAIIVFKEIFRSTEYTDEIMFSPPAVVTNDGSNFGTETSGGHIHLYLESKLIQGKDNKERQRVARIALEHLERTATHPKSKWSAAFFKKASQMHYGAYTEPIQDFCYSMMHQMHVVKSSPRMLRVCLLREIVKLCDLIQESEHLNLTSTLINMIKVFRRRSTVDYSVREILFRNFILDETVNKKTFKWPAKSTYAERIMAIGLHNGLYNNKDMHMCCLLFNIPYDTELPLQDKRHAFGGALRAFLNGTAIGLGTNQHRLQILFYNMTRNWRSMPGLTTMESAAILFIDDDSSQVLGSKQTKTNGGLEMAGEVLAGFLGTPIGDQQVETMYRAIVDFTNKTSG